MIYSRIFETYLLERSGELYDPPRNKFIDFEPKEKDKKLKDEFFDLISTAYAGLCGHIKFKKSSDMFKDKSINWLVSSHTLEHIWHPKGILGVLKEWIRVMKIGGLIAITVPSKDFFLHNNDDPNNKPWALAPSELNEPDDLLNMPPGESQFVLNDPAKVVNEILETRDLLASEV